MTRNCTSAPALGRDFMLTFRLASSHVDLAIEDGSSSTHHIGESMITNYSGIRRVFAAKKTLGERPDASHPARFVTRLGDVKVETKEPGGLGPIDHVAPVERYPG
jgi:hypothetical protein